MRTLNENMQRSLSGGREDARFNSVSEFFQYAFNYVRSFFDQLWDCFTGARSIWNVLIQNIHDALAGNKNPIGGGGEEPIEKQ